jgi:hypothetical protein
MQPEEDLSARCERRCNGRVERVDHGRQQPEVPDCGLGKVFFQRRLRRERCAHAPLLVANQVNGGVVGWKALRRSCESVAFEFAEGLADGGPAKDLSERLVIVEQPVADRGELFLLRHVGAGGDDDFFRADVEVVARARGLVEAGVRPPCGDVRFVGALVIAEARVAIDAEKALLGGAHVVGREVRHRVSDFANDGEHGLFQFGLEDGLARIEPVAVVVPGEVAQECQCLGAKVREGCCWCGFGLGCHGKRSVQRNAAIADCMPTGR